MQIGLGMLGWTPSEFWRSTPHELYSGIEGWEESNGKRKDEDDEEDEMNQDKMRDLMRKRPD